MAYTRIRNMIMQDYISLLQCFAAWPSLHDFLTLKNERVTEICEIRYEVFF